jgi:HEAT repeat protein
VHEPMPGVSGVRDAIVRLQFAEAVTKLGDYSNLNAIRAGAYSTMGEVQVLAVILLGDLQDRTMIPALRQMLDDPPVERQVAAAASLAKMGQFHGLETVLKASRNEGFLQRSQAAMALGYFDDDAAAQRLTELLADMQPEVRLSAAAGLLRMGPRVQGVASPAPTIVDQTMVDKPLGQR